MRYGVGPMPALPSDASGGRFDLTSSLAEVHYERTAADSRHDGAEEHAANDYSRSLAGTTTNVTGMEASVS